ncbi:hypothetical protein Hanom_Chr00s046614g01777411 [Helianthus anomalus]
MQFFNDMNLVGNMFVLKDFQREKFDYQEKFGHTIQLSLYDSRQIEMVKTFRAMLRKSIVYMSLVKLVRSPDGNILRSTEFTTIFIQPNMPEAHAI